MTGMVKRLTELKLKNSEKHLTTKPKSAIINTEREVITMSGNILGIPADEKI